MKKEIAEKWVKALRSGDYNQCAHRMVSDENNPEFCCLGVLADIYRKEVSKKPFSMKAITNLSKNKNNEFPSDKVFAWAGLSTDEDGDNSPMVNTKKYGNVSLASLNDSHYKSFKYIAKKIEKQWESL